MADKRIKELKDLLKASKKDLRIAEAIRAGEDVKSFDRAWIEGSYEAKGQKKLEKFIKDRKLEIQSLKKELSGLKPSSKTKPPPKPKGDGSKDNAAAAAAKVKTDALQNHRVAGEDIDEDLPDDISSYLVKSDKKKKKKNWEGITEAVRAAEDVRGKNLEKYEHLRSKAATAAAKKRERDHKEQKRIAFREDTFGDPEAESTLADRNWKGFKEEKDDYSEYDKYSGGGMVKTYARGGSPRKVRY